MKKIISTMLIMTLVLSFSSSFATTDTISGEIDLTTSNAQDTISKQIRSIESNNDIQIIGYEDFINANIREIEKDGVKVEKIKFNISSDTQTARYSSRSSSEDLTDLGDYKGYGMYQSDLTFEIGKDKVVKGKTAQNWIERGVSVALGFTTPYIWVPATLFGIPDFQDWRQGDKIEVTANGDKFVRSILIEDKNHRFSSHSGSYCHFSSAEKVKIRIDQIITKRGYENGGPQTEYIKDFKKQTASYSSISTLKKKAHYNYINNRNPYIEDLRINIKFTAK